MMDLHENLMLRLCLCKGTLMHNKHSSIFFLQAALFGFHLLKTIVLDVLHPLLLHFRLLVLSFCSYTLFKLIDGKSIH